MKVVKTKPSTLFRDGYQECECGSGVLCGWEFCPWCGGRVHWYSVTEKAYLEFPVKAKKENNYGISE